MSAALTPVREDNTHTHCLAQAAEMRDRARVKALLANGANVDAVTESGMTPLMYAASNGSAELVQILLDCGAQVNAKRNDGFTAIDLAAFFGQLGIVRLLLQKGADPEAGGRVETPAETWATVRGFVEIAETLRDASARNLTYPASGHSVTPNLESGGKGASLPVAVETVHQQEQVVTQSTTGGCQSSNEALKSPAASQFRPGLVFLEKMTASSRHLIILTLAVMIICGGATYGMLRTKALQNSTTETKSLKSVTPPATEIQKSTTSTNSKTARQVEPGSNPAATVVRSTSAEVMEAKPDPSAGIELGHKLDSRAAQPQKMGPYTFAVSANQTNATPTRKAAYWSPKRRNSSSIRTFPSSNPNSEIMLNDSSNSSKPMAESEDEPKPAPLSVSLGRTRSIILQPSNNDARVADQAPIVSTRPKSKVIQWP